MPWNVEKQLCYLMLLFGLQFMLIQGFQALLKYPQKTVAQAHLAAVFSRGSKISETSQLLLIFI